MEKNEIEPAATKTDTRAAGVDNAKPSGVDDTDLQTYVNELESELDQQIADLDTDHQPTHTDDNNDDIQAKEARAQASADVQYDSDYDSDDDTADVDETPLPRLRQNRTPSYGHLKGRDGDGSLPTVARPEEF